MSYDSRRQTRIRIGGIDNNDGNEELGMGNEELRDMNDESRET